MGNFVWYELATADIKAAKAFYTNVMGWGTAGASAYSAYFLNSRMINRTKIRYRVVSI